MTEYVDQQLSRLGKANQGPVLLQLMNSEGRTNWLNIGPDQYEAIAEILKASDV